MGCSKGHFESLRLQIYSPATCPLPSCHPISLEARRAKGCVRRHYAARSRSIKFCSAGGSGTSNRNRSPLRGWVKVSENAWRA